MLASAILSRASRRVGCSALSLFSSKQQQNKLATDFLANQFVHKSPIRFATNQASLLHHSAFKFSPFRFGFSSSATPEPNEKEHGNAAESVKSNGQTKESDSEIEVDHLSHDDLVKLVAEKEELLKSKQEEIKTMQDKLFRELTIRNIELKERKREAEKVLEHGHDHDAALALFIFCDLPLLFLLFLGYLLICKLLVTMLIY